MEVNRAVWVALLGLTIGPAAAVAQQAPAIRDRQPMSVSVSRKVVPGVMLRRLQEPQGPWTIHVLEADLRRRDLAVRAFRACDRLTGRERPSAMAQRLRGEGIDVIGMLNADFFDLRGGTGTNESNLVVDGELAKAVAVTESPFDIFDNVHSQFGVSGTGAPVLDRFALAGSVRTSRGSWPLAGVNPASLPTTGSLALFTRWSGWVIPAAKQDSIAQVTLELIEQRGDTSRYRVRPDSARGRSWKHPERIALLAGAGVARPAVAELRPGDEVTVVASLTPSPRAPLRTLVGGWPRIVRGGRSVAAAADSLEGTFPRFSKSRHPRSAVGISRDSATLYLVAVDGRSKTSVGMTLEELADAMISLGAYEALNLDGGGSTALVVGGTLVNIPSDSAGERPVGNVLALSRGSSKRRHVPAKVGKVAGCVLAAEEDPDTGRR